MIPWYEMNYQEKFLIPTEKSIINVWILNWKRLHPQISFVNRNHSELINHVQVKWSSLLSLNLSLLRQLHPVKSYWLPVIMSLAFFACGNLPINKHRTLVLNMASLPRCAILPTRTERLSFWLSTNHADDPCRGKVNAFYSIMVLHFCQVISDIRC